MLRLCKDCLHRVRHWLTPVCHRNRHEEIDPVTGHTEVKGIVDCELARDPAYLEDPDDPHYCGPEGRLWEPK